MEFDILLPSCLYNTVHNRHKTNENINKENSKGHNPLVWATMLSAEVLFVLHQQ